MGDQIKATLFGAEADALLPHIAKYPQVKVVDKSPDVVICYGGDGTLLSAELKWPGVP
ncbi:MAG: hypothetical protein IT367_14915, partial [Candidatus Hydrogenedentes bacterium]|nr:hypothetical protein [Candidatus Hydrogenedentota bacterium]